MVWPHTHENMRYIFLLDQFKDAILHGQLYPRWLPDLCGGYGYPTFVFYQPGFFYFSLPFSFLPGYPLWTMIFALVAMVFIGGLGAYQLGREMASRMIGLFCAALFLLTPYLYVNLYVRGDLSELAAMMLTPWPLFFLLRLKKSFGERKPSWVYALAVILSLAGVLVSHPATALFFIPAFCILSIIIAIDVGRLNKSFLGVVFCLVVAVFILASPYWLPLILMKKQVHFMPAISGLYSAELHTVTFSQFFKRDWGFGVSLLGSSQDGMSFQLGLPHFILALTGCIYGWKNRLIRASFVLYIFLILFMTSLTEAAWKYIPILRFVQFPWRILSVTSILQVICSSGIVSAPWMRKGRVANFFMAIVLVLSGFWYANQFQVDAKSLDAAAEFQNFKEHKLERFHTLTQTNEYLPTTVKTLEFYPRGNKPLLVTESGVEVRELQDHSPYRLHFEVEGDQPSIAQINQFYFPGWRVEINGQAVSDADLEQNLTPEGLMRVSLPSGKSTLLAYYGGPFES